MPDELPHGRLEAGPVRLRTQIRYAGTPEQVTRIGLKGLTDPTQPTTPTKFAADPKEGFVNKAKRRLSGNLSAAFGRERHLDEQVQPRPLSKPSLHGTPTSQTSNAGGKGT